MSRARRDHRLPPSARCECQRADCPHHNAGHCRDDGVTTHPDTRGHEYVCCAACKRNARQFDHDDALDDGCDHPAGHPVFCRCRPGVA